MKEYVGVFAGLLTDFVAFKQLQGYKYDSNALELHRFSVFSTQFKLKEPILAKEIVEAWNTWRPYEGLRNKRRRADVLRQFARYLCTLGHDAYIAPPDNSKSHYTFTPYIFTHSELERIFANTDKVWPNQRSNMYLLLPVIIRMLYSCGLRISEAVNLQNKHVDLRDGVLLIKNSKFGKDRMVPLSESLLIICRYYYRNLHGNSTPDDYFFMNIDRKPVTSDNIYRRFREILWASGISHGGKGQGPRVHDFRHTFAVHALKNAVDRQVDLYCALPILSTFLGHASIEATSQYLRLTAEHFPDICAALDKTCAYVIPEVVRE